MRQIDKTNFNARVNTFRFLFWLRKILLVINYYFFLGKCSEGLLKFDHTQADVLKKNYVLSGNFSNYFLFQDVIV